MEEELRTRKVMENKIKDFYNKIGKKGDEMLK